jgi:signal transduction histidine kinase
VHESARVRITRVFLATGTVIRKEPLGPDAPQRLRREMAALERLRGVPGIAQLVGAPPYLDSIPLQDAGDRTLGSSRTPLTSINLVKMAVQLATAVAEMHRHGVIHRDIQPANIMISRDGNPRLLDFSLATSMAEIRPEFTHHSAILGTLAYMAPEQTGRTARSVDYRADLYALGATLYELATGAPPFGSGDPLQLIHDHLARVPASPSAQCDDVPAALSEIIMHLLEKEPDSRYQTADGLLHDLVRLRDAGPGAPDLLVGERDFPERLLAPSRLVGRDVELAALHAALSQAVAGRCSGVLVSGAPGVGKTALIDQLRPVVSRSGGWFVSGKFDQYRRDPEFNATRQAFRALGRLLLAEPENELIRLRERMLRVVGANAGLLTAVLPEFATLLGPRPHEGDPSTAQARAQRASAAALRAIASPTRPVVMFIDDLQWGGPASVAFLDLVLSDEPIDGLLLVCAYRDVEAAHALATPLSRWREQGGVKHLRLANLPPRSLQALAGEMLHARPDRLAQLVTLIQPHTQGNPYETVELLNALRQEGLLTPAIEGWGWDDAAVGEHVGRSEPATLIATRVEAMPPSSREMVETMACLGGRAERRLLRAASAMSGREVDRALAPAVENGVLVLEPGEHEVVRFRHDRTREAILGGVGDQSRRDLHLAVARRTALVPELSAVAAEQYLQIVDALDDPGERQQVAALLRQEAEQAGVIGDHGRVNSLLTAALRLASTDDQRALVELHIGRHSALFNLGRLEEADKEYRVIMGLAPGTVGRTATAVQVRSLTARNRFVEAIQLGIGVLRESGITVPAEALLRGEVNEAFETVYRWLALEEADADLARPDVSDPALSSAGHLMNAMTPAVYFTGDHLLLGWMSLEALRLWIEHGPSRGLMGPAVHFAHTAIELRGDYAAGYRALRRLLTVSEARGYEPELSHALHCFNASARPWFEPIENNVHPSRRAREGLIAGGNPHIAGHTFAPATTAVLESAPSLDEPSAEVKAGLAFARRTGAEQTVQWLDGYRWLTDVLRGAAGDEADGLSPDERYAENPMALFYAHVNRSVAAAIFGDASSLERHTSRAMPLLPAVSGHYETAWARLLRGLAVAGQARDAETGEERDRLVSELADMTQWLAARASDAPDNFRHLVWLLEAETAWTLGDFRAASLAFDGARREVAGRQRPWHRALITERSARFFLTNGHQEIGEELLAQARQQYLDWGATAKVEQLDWAYPVFSGQPVRTTAKNGGRPADGSEPRPPVTTGTVDLLGILSASQALSSETSVERLRSSVTHVLAAMTGATGVQLLMWSEERQDWLTPAAEESADGNVDRVGSGTAVPMTVLRYAQRVRDPLVVSDATTDDRFASDPYFSELDLCSVLSVPILSRGTLQAVLLLENRLIRGAFTAERLDAVKLIASQLAVSLDNAHVYAEFRRMADEQAALRRVATHVAQGAGLNDVFDAVAAEVVGLLDANEVAVGRHGPQGEIAVLASRGSDVPGLSGGDERPRGSRSSAAAPIMVDRRSWGSITVSWNGESSPPAHREETVARFAELLGIAISNTDSRDELTASRARLVSTSERERRKLERDLHDGAQQRLVAAAINLTLANEASNERELYERISDSRSEIDQALRELREISHGLYPRALATSGLQRAFDWLATRYQGRVTVAEAAVGRFAPEVELAMYYCGLEAVQNASKHAGPEARITVRLNTSGDEIHLEVRDDGPGFDAAGVHDGVGLQNMRDRLRAVGGDVQITSELGRGTVVAARAPAQAPPLVGSTEPSQRPSDVREPPRPSVT